MVATAAATAAVAPQATTATKAAAPPPCTIRKYDHADDHPEIVRICEHVYGGTDYLPRVIEESAARDDVILCAEAAAGGTSDSSGSAADDQAPRLHGVVCAQRRGDGSAFVSGLRVCPDARQQGIGRLLMVRLLLHVSLSGQLGWGLFLRDVETELAAAAAQPSANLLPTHPLIHQVNTNPNTTQQQEAIDTHLSADPSVTALVSTTIPQQAATIRIFDRQGWSMQGVVECWPPYSVLHEYEERVGWPAVQASLELHGPMLDLVPRAGDVLSKAAVGGWQRCRSVDQLAAAVQSVRRRQRVWWRDHRRLQQGGSLIKDGSSSSEDSDIAAAAGLDSTGDAGRANQQRQKDTSAQRQLQDDKHTDWLPWVYDVLGVQGSEVAEMMADESCGFWLLPAAAVEKNGSSTAATAGNAAQPGLQSSSSGGSGSGGEEGWGAVVVLAHSKKFRRLCAGVLAATPDHITPSIARVAAAGPHFMCFMDQGARYCGPVEEGADRAAWPELYTGCVAPSSSFYVYVKPLDAGA